MKKMLLIVILLIISGIFITACAISTFNIENKLENKRGVSMDFELLPTMYSESNAKNQAWVGTFQLVWNDLIDELVKHPIEFVGYESKIAADLNKKNFTTKDLSEKAYYKKWGLISPKLKTEIENGIKHKFNEKSDILDLFDWTPEDMKYILYAMLKKDFEFIEKLANLGSGEFRGSEEAVEYFGVGKDSSDKQKKSVGVLFYNGPMDYAVVLKSKQGDIIKLYRTNDDKTLNDYYNDMNDKTTEYSSYLREEDRFKAPMMDFKSIRNFDELCNKEIKDSELIISKAIETIQFKMDEVGAKLKSEAAITTIKGCLPGAQVQIRPRYFYFDDKFVMFISEEGKKPYFAMKITDAAKLQR